MLEIRCFGDAVLSMPTCKVDFSQPYDIADDIAKMMATLRDKGGVGIAANQCADIHAPVPSIIIVGVTDEITRSKAQLRYPNMVIPDAMVMVNPMITQRSDELYFPSVGEGCLSVPCLMRGKVARHRSVTVQYQDINGKAFATQFSDLFAHILQHECDHLNGIVFINHILKEMNATQRQRFVVLIDEILANPVPAQDRPITPTLALDRDAQGLVVINEELIKVTLADLSRAVLLALKEASH